MRNQLRKDATIGIEDYRKQFDKASKHIEALTAYGDAIPEISPVIGTLQQAVKSYYSDNSNRGWAQQFALQDLQKLEELFPTNGE